MIIGTINIDTVPKTVREKTIQELASANAIQAPRGERYISFGFHAKPASGEISIRLKPPGGSFVSILALTSIDINQNLPIRIIGPIEEYEFVSTTDLGLVDINEVWA